MYITYNLPTRSRIWILLSDDEGFPGVAQQERVCLIPRAASASPHRCLNPNGISGRIQVCVMHLFPYLFSFKVFLLSHPTGAEVISYRNPRVGGGITYFLSFPPNSQLPQLLYFWFTTELPQNSIF